MIVTVDATEFNAYNELENAVDILLNNNNADSVLEYCDNDMDNRRILREAFDKLQRIKAKG
jgi:hypothetical protein